MLEDFKKFAMRGNVIDLAVGVIVGASFTGIVNSLVKDIIMPPLGVVMGGLDFSNFFITIKGTEYPTLKAAADAGAVTVNYGLFLNAIINFIIVALALFLVLHQLNKLTTPKPGPAPETPEDITLLREIRDALKAK